MLPSLLSLSAIVSAAPVGEDLAPSAPDLEALTLFCKDIGRTRPTFETGCYTVTGLSGQQIGCKADQIRFKWRAMDADCSSVDWQLGQFGILVL